MERQHKRIFLAVLPLAGVLCISPIASADYDDWQRRGQYTAEVSAQDLRSFQNYLDSHQKTAQELYRNPNLINDRDYVHDHKALRDWLEDHPDAARSIRANPYAFLQRDRSASAQRAFERGRYSTARVSEQDLRSFQNYLDSHWETAQLLRENPDLINNRSFLRDHDALNDWLEDHPDAAEAIQANPHRYLGRDLASQRPERRDYTARMSERDLRSFEAYLDSHRETAQLLYDNPDLINNRRFVRDHEALNDWLDEHPDAAEALRANPQKFLWRERTVGMQDFLNQLLR
jgi:hypothetical protein